MEILDRDEGEGHRERGEAEREPRHEQAAPASSGAADPVEYRLGAGGEQQREGPAEVVRLAPADGEEHDQDDVGDAERALVAQSRRAQQPDQARDPDRCEPDARELELLGHDRPARRGGAGAAVGDRARNGQFGPAVRPLPDEVGRPHRDRDRPADVQPRRDEHATRSGDRDADHDSEHEEGDQVRVEEPEAGNEPDRQPQTLRGGPQDPHDQEQEHGPGEQIEDRRVERVARTVEYGGERERGCRQELRAAARAELARERPGHEYDRPRGQRRGQAQHDE